MSLTPECAEQVHWLRLQFILFKEIRSERGMLGFAIEDMKTKAFTLIELLMVIAVLMILAMLMFPSHHGNQTKARRIACVGNLKQAALGIRAWSADHPNQLPNQVSTNDGGVMEVLRAGDLLSTFKSFSNELTTPVILFCPSDVDSERATNFANFDGRNISYFLSVDVSEINPEMIFSGDRNITNGTRLVSGLLNVSSNAPAPGWNEKIHQKAGNITLSDGSVQQLSINGLKDLATRQPDPTRLVLPAANENPM